MDAPKCRICEKHHWPRDPHSFGVDPKAPAGVRKSTWPPPKPSCPSCDALQGDIRRLNALVTDLQTALTVATAPEPRFDKTGYMRDYMRDRRAAAKAAPRRKRPKPDVPT